MRSTSGLKRLGTICAVGALTTLGLSATIASAAPANPDNGQVLTSGSGHVESFVAKKKATTVDRHAVSNELTQTFNAAAGSTFRQVRDQTLGTGHLSRFTQVIDGHIVAGSSVAQTSDKDGALIQAMGSVATGTSGAFPSQGTLSKGEKAAKAAAAASVKLTGAKTKVSQTVWFAPALTGASDASTVAQPAYQVLVSNHDSSYTVTVAATGAPTVLATATNTHELNRAVCDANRKSGVTYADLQCGVGTKNTLARKEGQAASSVADVNSVYNFFGDTSAFYAANTNAGDLTALVGANYNDSIGTAIRGSVRQCISGESCPYTNAFWSDEISAMVYGEGVTTDDVTGHELTHGVTSKTNGLLYQNESGAINESMSDIFGEFVDISNGSADDTAANRWKMGEGSSLGVIRDMKNPKNYQQPEIYKGTYWAPTSSTPNQNNDQGGVHTNSGVGNKLAYLITDGATFNGKTVTGLGIHKAAELYWTTQTLLPSNATYASLKSALTQACTANVTNGVAGTTSADCTQVANAIAAVGI
ncbi:M4 family metallopeptidase [Arthrobacter sp. NPDC090010]|uniref:M4 family metallopeptidase n=1 Tax=Arthrobacter sp. NPDC090010 TaxID=3363942 RepID=UPI0038279821